MVFQFKNSSLSKTCAYRTEKKNPSLAVFVLLHFNRNRFFVQLSVLTVGICHANVPSLSMKAVGEARVSFIRTGASDVRTISWRLLLPINQIEFAGGLTLGLHPLQQEAGEKCFICSGSRNPGTCRRLLCKF